MKGQMARAGPRTGLDRVGFGRRQAAIAGIEVKDENAIETLVRDQDNATRCIERDVVRLGACLLDPVRTRLAWEGSGMIGSTATVPLAEFATIKYLPLASTACRTPLLPPVAARLRRRACPVSRSIANAVAYSQSP
jgi:hypothetical protein